MSMQYASIATGVSTSLTVKKQSSGITTVSNVKENNEQATGMGVQCVRSDNN